MYIALIDIAHWLEEDVRYTNWYFNSHWICIWRQEVYNAKWTNETWMLSERLARVRKLWQGFQQRNAICLAKKLNSIASGGALSFPLRCAEVEGHTAMRAAFDRPQWRHANDMDERTAARPTLRRVVDVSGDRLAADVQMTNFTCEWPELSVISVGSKFITDIGAETSSCE